MPTATPKHIQSAPGSTCMSVSPSYAYENTRAARREPEQHQEPPYGGSSSPLSLPTKSILWCSCRHKGCGLDHFWCNEAVCTFFSVFCHLTLSSPVARAMPAGAVAPWEAAGRRLAGG